MELIITSIEPKTCGNIREVHVHFNDGKVVKIGTCDSSWAMWNAPMQHRWMAVGIANKCNDWIHGVGEFPKFHNYQNS